MYTSLIFKSQVATMCTTYYNTTQLFILHTLYLCASYELTIKYQLLHYRKLIDWSF